MTELSTRPAETSPARWPVPPRTDPAGPRRGSDFAELSRRIKDAGLLARRPGYYAAKIGLTAALLVAGWTVFVLLTIGYLISRGIAKSGSRDYYDAR